MFAKGSVQLLTRSNKLNSHKPAKTHTQTYTHLMCWEHNAAMSAVPSGTATSAVTKHVSVKKTLLQ